MSQDRFQTSREVYHRIRWDPRLDPHDFTIGYDARGEQMEEVPFLAFVPDGEIPWHRVWYFQRGHERVWDRRERIDRMSDLGLEPVEVAAPAAPPRSEAAPSFTPLPSFRYEPRSSTWIEVEAAAPGSEAPATPAQLTVATLNVLFDLYDPELLDTRRRTRATLALLRPVDADLIALQEVTAPFLQALLELPWVREHYFVSEGPSARTVEPYGQVLLSRFPFASLSQCVFSRDKRIIAGELAFAEGPLWVATPHLTSDHDPSGAAARTAQLQSLVHWARALPEVLLLGDFNAGDDAPELQGLEEEGLTDAWKALRPGEAGFTYDPSRNALAALTTTSGRSRRLDRILVRSSSGRLLPRAVRLFAEAPLSGPPAPGGGALFASDHFGVECELSHDPEKARTPVSEPSESPALPDELVHQTAVVIIPPEAQWGPIQALRAAHDSKYARWMPHVTLLYPFVPEERFAEAEALLTRALGEVAPFDVTLSGFETFEHRSHVTAWLRPEERPRGALQALHSALEPKAAHSGRAFTPHLSVGQLPRAEGARNRELLAEWTRDWRPLDFRVGEVCLISRRGSGPFEVRRRIPLGGGLASAVSAREEGFSPESRRAREEGVSRLQALCARLGAELHPYGSSLLGTDTPRSDVDAVAIGPSSLSREDFARALAERLSGEGSASVRFVADAALPLVKLTFEGVAFDVTYARRPEGVEPGSPAQLLAEHAERLEPDSVRALNGWTDTRALLEGVTREGAGPERFRAVMRAVRAWAKARGVYSHALGYLGGVSWAVLVAWACMRAPREAARTDEGVLAYFFETFSAWPWPKPVTLTPETARYVPGPRRDLLPVVAPTLPARNTARNVSRSTRRILSEELTRGLALVRAARAHPSPPPGPRCSRTWTWSASCPRAWCSPSRRRRQRRGSVLRAGCSAISRCCCTGWSRTGSAS